MTKILLFSFFLCAALSLFGQDTLVTWSDEEILGKIVKIEKSVVTIVLVDEPDKEYRIHKSELQRATYENGNTLYFFDKFPDVVTKMKKSAPRKNMIEFSPLGPMFNHFYIGYEHLFAKKMTYEIQAGVLAPMALPLNENLKGFQLNFAWKNIYSETVKFSGLSVRPKMQGAYIGFLLSLNYISFNDNIYFPSDSGIAYSGQTVETRVKGILSTLHFVFGYNKLVAPAIMLGFCAGVGGGPMIVLNSNEYVKKQASLPTVAIAQQRFLSNPFSLTAVFTCGILLK